ncbi:diacylglycerol/lipid kinase family protein [Gryllotalpicola ginsengisoli]|uniref:diacylglycerol/lipid kinase family protein n=1 Tax=Gryllotalpicola ginsengisoli TaxID=444608 RepID=UPI0003B57C8C|nr:diacylglycerol kinase family protein [Gryllotalpicola ginsengisoli]
MPTEPKTTLRRIVVAVNPAAAFGRHAGAGEAVADVLAAAGHTVIELRQPNYELLRREVEHAVDARGECPADALVVVGGDGMVSLGLNIVAETGVALGIVPAGTGNDAARSLGLPLDDPRDAARAVVEALRRGPHAADAGRVRHGVHTTWVFGSVSAGFDAAVNERANLMSWPNSEHKYKLAVLRELLTFRAPRYRLVVDGEARELRAMLVAVANHSSIGGGMRIAPDARVDDGYFDLFVVDRMPRLRFLTLFPKVFRGQHAEEREVHLEHARRVRIEAEHVVAYGDGERIGPLPVEVELVPGVLQLLVDLEQS